MTNRILGWGMLAMLGAGSLPAQRNAIVITPRITGGDSSNGKCIIRIMVDDTVSVRIGNGQVRVQTISGRDSRDDGSECSSMLQNGRNLSNFRFRGIDGRGQVRLESDPRENPRGEAVVSIRDAKGGDEGYTFEVSWQGDHGNRNGGGTRGGFLNGNARSNNNDSGFARALNACQEDVRRQVRQDYGITDLNFDAMNTDNNAGRRDRISGTARAGRRDVYQFDCDVNLSNGNVRNVKVRRN